MRLDVFLVENGYVRSRARAKVLIEGGFVTLDGKPATKASSVVSDGAHEVRVLDELPYVSRGGLKLEAALDAFGIDVADMAALDIGASTGGFTDCLLQRGAATVCAVDAGQGQLAEKLRADKRVSSFEHMNARDLTLEAVGGKPFDLIVMDVSFISATYILPCFPVLMKPEASAVVLIKPQFEVGRALLGKGGIVRDRAAHRLAVQRVIDAGLAAGLLPIGLIPSPVEGGDGNREFLVHFSKIANTDSMLTTVQLDHIIGK